MIGTTLAHYKVTAALGVGGMGEVWRAEDEKLGREVALKVLPEEFAQDPERMARFEREAKVLASLNHPNIATLYGLETVSAEPAAGAAAPQGSPGSPEVVVAHASRVQAGDSDAPPAAGSSSRPQAPITTIFLAMELVEGEDLSERIKRGPVPIEEATAIALQIAEALEAAHESGIVHRDLKPANIKLRPDGTVKVLDFGLAKAWETDHGDSSISMSPTLTQHATAAGIILGTAAYMSPEQAAGIAADRRADIWAFGVVFWEMLTGHKLFEGETVSHVLASVLKDEVDLDELPPETPAPLRKLISRCLRKKPKQRLQAIGDARIALEEYMADPEGSVAAPTESILVPTAMPQWRRLLPWAVAGILAVAAAGVLWSVRGTAAQVISATIPPPVDAEFYLNPNSPGPVAVSPDGRSLAFSAQDLNGDILLYVRRLDAPQAQALSGTDNAGYPFWSPDSRWIGYFNRPEGTLKKIDTNGGPPITLTQAPNGKGGTWNDDGVIVFAPDASTPLHRVASAGGESVAVTEIDGEFHNSHRHPRFLPDGNQVLFLARGNTPQLSRLLVVDLGGGTTREVMATETQADFGSGHLLFVREHALMAQPFDPGTAQFEGEAVPLAEEVLTIQGASLADFSLSATGILSFATGRSEEQTQLEWRDRKGDDGGTVGDEASYRTAVLSPDGTLAIAEVIDEATGTQDLWVFDIERGLRTRFTFDPAQDIWPVWSPGGRTVYFASNRQGNFGIYRKSLEGAGEVEEVIRTEADLFPSDVSPDGSKLMAFGPVDGAGVDLFVAALDGSADLQPWRPTEFNESVGVFSPDGKWVVYHSNESGTLEIYVASFPGPGRRWQVSTDGGVYPTWRADGAEVIYTRLEGTIMVSAVRAESDSFFVDGEEQLFAIGSPQIGGPHFSVSADAQRFLVVPPTTQRADSLLHLLVNWPTALEARR
ncbi:MAG: protein kinase [Acidobacteriota bacterium]|nr:protein kinase [Acidobacteriota bacterium]